MAKTRFIRVSFEFHHEISLLSYRLQFAECTNFPTRLFPFALVPCGEFHEDRDVLLCGRRGRGAGCTCGSRATGTAQTRPGTRDPQEDGGRLGPRHEVRGRGGEGDGE